jgi:hypothetical protein
MRRRLTKHIVTGKRLSFVAVSLGILLGVVVSSLLPGSAAKLSDRHLRMTTAEISATSLYEIEFDLVTPGTLGSIVFQFCANDPNPLVPCTIPAGFDISGATLSSQAGPGGFSIAPGATSNRIVLTRTPAFAAAGTATFNLDGVTNPSSPGSYYIRMLTYASDDGTGSYIDEGGIAFAVTTALSVTATVPPYLTFCTGLTITGLNCANAEGDYIDFGELSSTRANRGSSQMLAATNAQDGYNISVTGTTMMSGVNEITALTANDVSRPGTPQFGMNLKSNSAPSGGTEPFGPGVAMPMPNYSTPNTFRFVDGETLVRVEEPDDVRQYTASYIVNVPRTQAPGIYVTTLTYICLATF